MLDLSIIHTIYNRYNHTRAILPRFEFNHERHPEIDFELVVLDGGSNDGTEQLCLDFLGNTKIKMKYIRANFGKWTNPSLPRNIALRYVEAPICVTTDADHWVGQDFVSGAYRAFADGSMDKVSIGMVWDTSESQQICWNHINDALLNKLSLNTDIIELYEIFGIPIKEPKSGWIVAYPMWAAKLIGGYCEKFTGSNWSREEDVFLLSLQTILKTTKEYCKEFSAIHLCHTVEQFGIQRNSHHNHQIFKKILEDLPKTIRENKWENNGKIPPGINFYVRSNF